MFLSPAGTVSRTFLILINVPPKCDLYVTVCVSSLRRDCVLIPGPLTFRSFTIFRFPVRVSNSERFSHGSAWTSVITSAGPGSAGAGVRSVSTQPPAPCPALRVHAHLCCPAPASWPVTFPKCHFYHFCLNLTKITFQLTLKLIPVTSSSAQLTS